MHRILTAAIGVALAGAAGGQAAVGDLLVNSLNFPDGFVLVKPDGNIQQISGSGASYSGAAVLPDGTWCTTRQGPTPGVDLFDPRSGALIGAFDLPPGSLPSDLAARGDGMLVVSDHGRSRLLVLDRTGTLLDVQPLGAGAWPGGLALHRETEEAWVSVTRSDGSASVVRFGRDGAWLGTFAVANALGDLDVAEDGTVWGIEVQTGVVVHYDDAGNVLSSFAGTSSDDSFGIAVGPDGNLWIGSYPDSFVRRHRPDGALLELYSIPAPVFRLHAPRRELVGESYCTAVPNSTGRPGKLFGHGLAAASRNDLTLYSTNLPPAEAVLALNAPAEAQVPNFGGGDGTLCLGGRIARHMPGFVRSDGTWSERLDLDALPRGGGAHQVLPGETWRFQVWHRDGGSSNLSRPLRVTFR